MLESTQGLFLRGDKNVPGSSEPAIPVPIHPTGDLATCIDVYLDFKTVASANRRAWCAARLLSRKALEGIESFVKSCTRRLTDIANKPLFDQEVAALATTAPFDAVKVNRCFATAYFDNICVSNGTQRAGMLLVRDIPAGYVDSTADRSEESDSDTDEGDEETCAICLNTTDDFGAQCTTLPCNHTFHTPCIEPWLRVRQTCPLCVSPILFGPNGSVSACPHTASAPPDPAIKGSTAVNVFVHPSSMLFMQKVSGWVAYHTLVKTSRQYMKMVVAVDPYWEEIAQHVSVAAIEAQAKTASRLLPLPLNLVGAFVGKQASALRQLEGLTDALICMPERDNKAEVVDLEVFATTDHLDTACKIIAHKIGLLVLAEEARLREREQRQAEYIERQEARARRQAEYLERKRVQAKQRAQWHQEHLAREADREARRRDRAQQMNERNNRNYSRPYCGTPGRDPPYGYREDSQSLIGRNAKLEIFKKKWKLF